MEIEIMEFEVARVKAQLASRRARKVTCLGTLRIQIIMRRIRNQRGERNLEYLDVLYNCTRVTSSLPSTTYRNNKKRANGPSTFIHLIKPVNLVGKGDDEVSTYRLGTFLLQHVHVNMFNIVRTIPCGRGGSDMRALVETSPL
ncbi:unnamed protein product [Amoebophrya sp. A25]|nr:unnamed protein product [Amoebophrya sp. A25]|eukprot:GSA25T00016046001.1